MRDLPMGSGGLFKHVGYVNAIFRSKAEAAKYYDYHNPRIRALNAYGTWCSDWDPDTYLRYVVREDHDEIACIDPFDKKDSPEVRVQNDDHEKPSFIDVMYPKRMRFQEVCGGARNSVLCERENWGAINIVSIGDDSSMFWSLFKEMREDASRMVGNPGEWLLGLKENRVYALKVEETDAMYDAAERRGSRETIFSHGAGFYVLPCLCMTTEPVDPREERAHIVYSVWVHTRARRRGLGRSLLHKLRVKWVYDVDLLGAPFAGDDVASFCRACGLGKVLWLSSKSLQSNSHLRKMSAHELRDPNIERLRQQFGFSPMDFHEDTYYMQTGIGGPRLKAERDVTTSDWLALCTALSRAFAPTTYVFEMDRSSESGLRFQKSGDAYKAMRFDHGFIVSGAWKDSRHVPDTVVVASGARSTTHFRCEYYGLRADADIGKLPPPFTLAEVRTVLDIMERFGISVDTPAEFMLDRVVDSRLEASDR
ncbi:hypothetical protein CYMTET_28964 [Cymbomonas tetramitiformis]|uniref:Uncharacterized protein n=1 Tax=Cymbomonas tetramitiformis TaxID=36881 RepID=A0AAE0FLX9_9CHLO|nr:hypothetical protein CYMTET_28964 [Cymbomonas tetramitiformis]